MGSPVQLSDLDLATVAADDDLALIRKSNTTDFKVSVANLRKINLAGLPSLPVTMQPTDLMLISQSGQNCKINFGSVGFTVGTKMWFFSATEPVAPTFWQIIPNTGDRLLAVATQAIPPTQPSPEPYAGSQGGVSAGNWQQTNVVLNIEQIPAHSHISKLTGGNPSGVFFPGGSLNFSSTNKFETQQTGGQNSTSFASPIPSLPPLPHNHGNTWRPLANVGIICQKIL